MYIYYMILSYSIPKVQYNKLLLEHSQLSAVGLAFLGIFSTMIRVSPKNLTKQNMFPQQTMGCEI